jgi:hypothetical protein
MLTNCMQGLTLKRMANPAFAGRLLRLAADAGRRARREAPLCCCQQLRRGAVLFLCCALEHPLPVRSIVNTPS